MANSDIQIRDPRVIFLDGTISSALVREEMVVGDKPQIKMVMCLSRYMQRYAKVRQDELRFERDAPMKGDGYITRTYDAANKCILSNNPEYPLIMMACNFAGDPVNVSSPNMEVVVQLINTLKTRDSTISALKRTITELETELETMMSTSKRAMERRKQASGMEDFKEIMNNMVLDRSKLNPVKQ